MARRTTRTRRVATVVPLALVSAAWTTHLASAGPATTSAAVPPAATPGRVPDTARLPGAPVDYPASLSEPDSATAAGERDFSGVVPAVSSGEIPSAALAAYQRAETVINAADPGCHLNWQLVAAIGRVESNHGRYGGSVLGADGVARPGITGPVLDGRNGTSLIADTDAGQYDDDPHFDRAVGPMQFIPSTWAVVGVDADNDGVRDPQDIDDAALAAAVYLCSGDEDLAQDAGRRASVYRYNHSDSYVDLVLSVMADYLQGDYSAGTSPTTVSAGYVGPEATEPPVSGPPVPDLGPALALDPASGQGPRHHEVGEPTGVGGGTELEEPTDPTGEPTDPTEEPTDPTDPTDPTEEPTDPGEPTGPADPPVVLEPQEPTLPPAEQEPQEPAAPLPGTLSQADAEAYCAETVATPDDPTLADDPFDLCVVDYTIPAPVEPVEPAEPAAPAPQGGTSLSGSQTTLGRR